jgi:hypothetical protein
VYIKTRGPEGPDVRFTLADATTAMGDTVSLSADKTCLEFKAHVIAGRGQRVEVIRNGEVRPDLTAAALASDDEMVTFALDVAPGDWVRLNIRNDAGVTVMTNPIYFR